MHQFELQALVPRLAEDLDAFMKLNQVQGIESAGLALLAANTFAMARVGPEGLMDLTTGNVTKLAINPEFLQRAAYQMAGGLGDMRSLLFASHFITAFAKASGKTRTAILEQMLEMSRLVDAVPTRVDGSEHE